MKPVEEMKRHDTSERLVDILCNKAQNDNRLFFRTLVAYYMSKVASMMHCGIKTLDRGNIPINCYVVNLASSGSGKGLSMNIMEDRVIDQFRERFLEETFPAVAETNIAKLAVRRAAKKNTDPDGEIAGVNSEFERLGPLVFSFDSGTTPAVKQMRHKLLMANAGSMNLEIDEIGSNLVGNVEVLNTFLELFDVGKVKQKLTKNTNENQRSEDIDGRTPTNMMLFGTPAKLLNGGKVEEEFYSMLETGYARRCLFGFSREATKRSNMTAEEVLDSLTDTNTEQFLSDLSNQIANLADTSNFHQLLEVSRETTLTYIQYKLDCEKKAESMPDHEEIRKSELSHRYFKALKLAGAYAFIDGSHELTMAHLEAGIKLVEESGEAFSKILTRDRNYAKLANYIADVGREITSVDLVEDLPFYKGSASQKADLMALAIAYGYKNNIIIKKYFTDGIEFFKGESIKKTDLNNMIVSYTHGTGHPAHGFENQHAPFDELHRLTQLDDYHWVSHHLADGHRIESNVVPGFNLLALDIDGTANLDTVKLLLKDYSYHIHTTKRHTDQQHRFRLIMPLSHTLKMDAEEYKDFVGNILEWLPFEVDAAANQRARKWATYDGEYWVNEGKLLDALPFIPKTSKNDERQARIADLGNLDNLERWFISHTGAGNRSNQLIRYAKMLVDAGASFNEVRTKVLDLNSKIPDKLDESEILSTIMVTIGQDIGKRDAAL